MKDLSLWTEEDEIVEDVGFRKKIFYSEDFYNYYPYKKQRPHGSTIPSRPYVKKSEVSNHEFAIDFNEWREIMKCYAEVLIESLFDGHCYIFSSMIGELAIKKKKVSGSPVNWGATIKHYQQEKGLSSFVEARKQMEIKRDVTKLIRYDNKHTRNHIAKLELFKARGYNYKWKKYWFFSEAVPLKKKLGKLLKSDIFAINTFPEIYSVGATNKK